MEVLDVTYPFSPGQPCDLDLDILGKDVFPKKNMTYDLSGKKHDLPWKKWWSTVKKVICPGIMLICFGNILIHLAKIPGDQSKTGASESWGLDCGSVWSWGIHGHTLSYIHVSGKHCDKSWQTIGFWGNFSFCSNKPTQSGWYSCNQYVPHKAVAEVSVNDGWQSEPTDGSKSGCRQRSVVVVVIVVAREW